MKIDRIKIETILAKRNMTRVQLSKQSGVSRQSISTIMTRGTCEPRTAGKIAAALEVDIEQLIAKEA